jgi:hypothetical protein
MENIEVVLRVRPRSRAEINRREEEPWMILPPSSIALDCDIFDNWKRAKKLSPNLKTEFSFSMPTYLDPIH